MSDLSIIIVSWNTRDLLRQCLISLGENLTGLSHEIYVVDNGSIDGSVVMVRSEFPEIKLIENKRNLGFARANNLAMRAAGGRFFLLLNSDTMVKKGAIEGLLETMRNDPCIGIAGLQLLNSDGSKQNSICSFPSLLTELTNKSLLRALFPSKYPGKEHQITTPIEVDAVIGSCMLVRRDAVDAVGLLDEDYFFFFEETDWCMRMQEAGWKVVFDPRHSIIHLQGKTAANVNVRARIEYWRSRYTYFRKHFGLITRYILQVGLITRLSIDILLAGAAGIAIFFAGAASNEKPVVYNAILKWHIKGRPADGGLEATETD